MAFIEPMHRNKPNITYLLSIDLKLARLPHSLNYNSRSCSETQTKIVWQKTKLEAQAEQLDSQGGLVIW